MTEDTLLYTIPEAGRQLRLCRDTVYELISDGELEAIDCARPGSKKTKLRVPREAVLAYIANRPRVVSGGTA